MSDLVALFDLDSTLADYDGAMRRAFAQIAAPGDPDFRSFTDEARPPWMEARRQLISSLPGFWLNLEPLAAGFTVVDQARAAGLRVHVLTKGPRAKPAAWAEKLQWCVKYIPDASVSITEDKSLSYGRIMVDDWPPFYNAWLRYRPRGVVIVPAQPWNVDAESHAPGRVFRYDPTQAGADQRLCEIVHAAAQRADGEDVWDIAMSQ